MQRDHEVAETAAAPEAAGAPNVGPMHGLSKVERVWQTVRDHPGLTSTEYVTLLQPLGLGPTSVHPVLSALANGGLIRRGDKKLPATGSRYPAYTFFVSAPEFNSLPGRYTRVGDRPAPSKPAPTPAPSIDQVESMSNRQIVWTILKQAPGLTTNELTEIATAFDVENVASIVRQLCVLNLMRQCGTRDIPLGNGGVRQVAAYEAIGDVSSFSTARRAQPKAKAAAAVAAAEPAEPAEPVELAQSEPEKKDSWRNGKRTHWSQEEIEAICVKWARDHIRKGIALSDLGLSKITNIDGFGYRPRKLGAGTRRDFCAKYLPLVQAEVERQRKAPADVPPAAATVPAPMTPPEPMPAAPLPAQSLGGLIEQALSHMIDRSVAQHMASVEERLSDKVSSMFGFVVDALKTVPGIRLPAPRHDPTAPSEDKVKKQMVIIVSGLPAQFDSVKRSFPDLDLRHYPHPAARIPAEEPDAADLVVSLTKFIGHPLDRSLRKKYGAHYCPVNGAADSVKIAITERLGLTRVQ